VWIDVSHLGADLVERSFKGMVKRCRDFGRDLARQPVEVGPTTHFMMGGVVIDPECRTEIEGLFAAGEDAGGVHGANRLGGNGVAESTVFGSIAGDVMADWVAGRPAPVLSHAQVEPTMRRATAPLGRAAGEDLYALQSRLREVMWDRVGLIRMGEGLRSALAEIAEIGRRAEATAVPGGPAYNVSWQDWLNVRSQAAVGWLIARSALERSESRGSHFRSDHPRTSNELMNVYVGSPDGKTPKVWTEPVRLTRLRPESAQSSMTVEVGD